MTGDNYYQTARSAFHRLSGHLELRNQSTQNQLLKGIKREIFQIDPLQNLTPEQYHELIVSMYHFPLKGFIRGLSKTPDSEGYITYKTTQKKIHAFEKRLIHDFKDMKLLNKTLQAGNITAIESEFQPIYDNIERIIRSQN